MFEVYDFNKGVYLSQLLIGKSDCSWTLGEDNSNNHTIQTKSLGEDEYQNHTNEDLSLLGVCSDSSISNNTNSETSSLIKIKCVKMLTRDERPQQSPEAKCL
jgi:hypothetical protein